MTHEDRIQQLLLEKPGLKAQQIATDLGLERSRVAAALQTLARSELTQDSAYRWRPRQHAPCPPAEAPHTVLASLCRYYLECLAHEIGSGISLPDGASDVEYVALTDLPFARADAAAVTDCAV